MSHESRTIPYGRQSITDEDVSEVVRVLRSPFLTQGPEIERFESTLARTVGARFATAVCNATAGLHLACRALDVGPGDIVWTTPNSFVASANCALYCGASVDFVDIDAASYNVDAEAFAEKLNAAERVGRLPKVFVAVHFAGTPCDLASIYETARRYGVAIIEDASHAIGATYRKSLIGDSHYSDLTVFSFHPVKIVTTGEGGAVVTNRSDLHERLHQLRTHGITRLPAEMIDDDQGAWYYEQRDLGYNYRLTDIAAALGTIQLSRLPEFLARRRNIVQRYGTLLADAGIGLPRIDADRRSAWHLYVIQVPTDKRRAIFDALRADDILVNVHYIPIHLQPYYRNLGFAQGQFPVAEQYYAQAISLPIYYELNDEQQDRVVRSLKEALQGIAS